MTKIVTQLINPAIPAGAFATRPKTAYLAGTKYGRVEEELDVENNIHGLLITNEPDSWMINLADNTGRHIVDPGPSFEMHSPIVWTAKPKGQPDPEKYFKNLEFGNELQFFRQHKARELGRRDVDGQNCKALSLKSGALEVVLLLDPNSGQPYQINIVRDGKLDSSIRYLVYETDLPFDKSLFEPPKGVKITEANASAARPVVPAGAANGKDLRKFSDEMAYFYLAPTKERFEAIQTEADELYDEMQKTGSRAEMLSGVFIAKVSTKHHWPIIGTGKASAIGKDVVSGQSQYARYVNNDSIVDPHKLDIWWLSFFATGDEIYLNKILNQARIPVAGEKAKNFILPATAAWSFKTNCKQHKAIVTFAKNCLERNLFPTKKDFLKECILIAGDTPTSTGFDQRPSTERAKF